MTGRTPALLFTWLPIPASKGKGGPLSFLRGEGGKGYSASLPDMSTSSPLEEAGSSQFPSAFTCRGNLLPSHLHPFSSCRVQQYFLTHDTHTLNLRFLETSGFFIPQWEGWPRALCVVPIKLSGPSLNNDPVYVQAPPFPPSLFPKERPFSLFHLLS